MADPPTTYRLPGKRECLCFVLGPMEVNTYLLVDPDTRSGLVVDPAYPSDELVKAIRDRDLKHLQIFLTHGHADHLFGVDPLREAVQAMVLIPAGDAPMLADPALNLSQFLGFPFTVRPPDRLLDGGNLVQVGESSGEVVLIPGHTPGGAALVFPEVIFSGDTLFAGSIGRSDLPGGDGSQLVTMIRSRLLTLSDRLVLPGHGPNTTLGEEIRSNPFLQG